MNEQPTFTSICWSEKQGAYIGQVGDLVGVEGTGSTSEDALASVLEAIRWWQEMRVRQPIPPAQPDEHP